MERNRVHDLDQSAWSLSWRGWPFHTGNLFHPSVALVGGTDTHHLAGKKLEPPRYVILMCPESAQPRRGRSRLLDLPADLQQRGFQQPARLTHTFWGQSVGKLRARYQAASGVVKKNSLPSHHAEGERRGVKPLRGN